MNKTYDVGIYVRLSREDAVNTRKRKSNPFAEESVSIENQRDILSKYVQLRGWREVMIYSDDGFSGGNFERPGFQRMIKDAQAGLINLILVKDLSRLGRDYVAVGHYTDTVFPSLGCRFIALMDDIDSEGNDDLLPFRSVLNDYHLRDLSRKIKSVRRAKARAGQYMCSIAPYGYQINPSNRLQLIADPEAAEIVRHIFELRLRRMGYGKIAAALNNGGILAPKAYSRNKAGQPYTVKESAWHETAIMRILKRDTYLGHTTQMKQGSKSYKNNKLIQKPEDEWIRVENTHEPIVAADVWAAAQQISLTCGSQAVQKAPERSLFNGLLACADCGASLKSEVIRRKRVNGEIWRNCSYSCVFHHQTGGTGCTKHRISELALLRFIKADVQRLLEHIDMNGGKLLSILNDALESGAMSDLRNEINRKRVRLDELDALYAKLYEDRLNGVINLDTFQKLSANAERERVLSQSEFEQLRTKLENAERQVQDVGKLVEAMRNYVRLEKPDHEILTSLIDKIEIGEKTGIGNNQRQDIKIRYRFVGNINKL